MTLESLQNQLDQLTELVKQLEEGVIMQGEVGEIGPRGKIGPKNPPGEPPPGPIFQLMKSSPPSITTNGKEPEDLVVSLDGENVYAVTREPNQIIVYTRDTATGRLTIKEAVAVEGQYPTAIVIDKLGENVYVLTGDNTAFLARYGRDLETGALHLIHHINFEAPAGGPPAMAISPDGQYLYLSHYVQHEINKELKKSDWLDVVAVEAVELTVIQSIQLATSAGQMAVSDDETFIYTIEYSTPTSQLRIFGRNLETGMLTEVHSQAVAAGDGTGIVISPDQGNLYIGGNGHLCQFERNQKTGLLTALNPEQVELGGAENTHGTLGISPDGRAIYMGDTNSGELFQAPRSLLTGTINPVEPKYVGIEGKAWRIVFTPDGRSTYIANLQTDVINCLAAE